MRGRGSKEEVQMKRSIAVLVLMMVLASALGASASEENIPTGGTKQMMFGFSGWYLNEYKSGIGLRYYLRKETALRFEVDVKWTKDDDTGWVQEVRETEDPRQHTYVRGASTFSAGAGTMLERHFRYAWNVVPYAGLGVFGRYDKYEHDEAYDSSDREYTTAYTYESKGYTIEGLLLAGLQWHFAPNMSLGGEYRIKVKYSYREYEDTYSREDRYTNDHEDRHRTDYDARKDWNLTLDSSALWLAISF
jgi:opacity protein-like surface antigen